MFDSSDVAKRNYVFIDCLNESISHAGRYIYARNVTEE